MNLQVDPAETERISVKQPMAQLPALRQWKHLPHQQQNHLAKLWAQLLKRMLLSLKTTAEVQDVKD